GAWQFEVQVAARPTPPRDPRTRARRPAPAQRVVLVCVRLLTGSLTAAATTSGQLDSRPAPEVGDARDLQPRLRAESPSWQTSRLVQAAVGACPPPTPGERRGERWTAAVTVRTKIG